MDNKDQVVEVQTEDDKLLAELAEQMSGSEEIAVVFLDWLESSAVEALNNIQGKDSLKVRTLVIRLAFAGISKKTMNSIFLESNTYSQKWYGDIRHREDVKLALKLCTEKAYEWHNRVTALEEMNYYNQRRTELAKGSVTAAEILASIASDIDVRPADRVKAADTLLVHVRNLEKDAGSKRMSSVVDIPLPSDVLGGMNFDPAEVQDVVRVLIDVGAIESNKSTETI